ASFLGMMAQYYNDGAGTLWINIGIAWSYFILCFLIGPKLSRFGKLTISDYLAERFDSPLLSTVFSIILTIWINVLLDFVIFIAWSYFILCFLIGPKLSRFGKLTISDYLAERFDSPLLSPVFSIIVTIWMIVLLGSLYVQGGIMLSSMFGLDYATSTIVVVGLVVVFTIFGGMVIVLNTDFIAMIILIIALAFTIPFLVQAADSWGSVVSEVSNSQPNYFTSSGGLTPFMAFSLFFIWLF